MEIPCIDNIVINVKVNQQTSTSRRTAIAAAYVRR